MKISLFVIKKWKVISHPQGVRATPVENPWIKLFNLICKRVIRVVIYVFILKFNLLRIFFSGLPQGQEKSGKLTKFCNTPDFVCLSLQSFLNFKNLQMKKKKKISDVILKLQKFSEKFTKLLFFQCLHYV